MIEIKPLDIVENEKEITRLLDEHRDETFGFKGTKSSCSFAIYEDGVYLGGISARRTVEELHISQFAMDPRARGKGYGQKLFKECEAFALKEGCKVITVTTQSFQARPFYEKQGYTVFGQIEDVPFIGTTRYYLVKRLDK